MKNQRTRIEHAADAVCAGIRRVFRVLADKLIAGSGTDEVGRELPKLGTDPFLIQGSRSRRGGFQSCLVVNAGAVLLTWQAIGQVDRITPQWKNHFARTPVIENCVFERKTPPMEGQFASNGETNLYQFRYQENAFLIRQIRNVDDALLDHVPFMGIYAGRFGSNYWAIDAGDTLKLFPNVKDLSKAMSDNDGAVILFAERMIFATLYYGISLVDPTTLEWTKESTFTARSVFGDRYVGEVIKVSDGRPKVLEWHSETMPEKRFVLEYEYEPILDLAYFPSVIRLFMNAGGQKTLGAVYRIVSLKVSTLALEESVFDPRRYFTNRWSTVSPRTFIHSNKQVFALMGDGRLDKVLPSSMMPYSEKHKPAQDVRTVIQVIVFGVAVFPLVGLMLLWRRRKAHKTNNK